jgi:hypothetical protein
MAKTDILIDNYKQMRMNITFKHLRHQYIFQSIVSPHKSIFKIFISHYFFYQSCHTTNKTILTRPRYITMLFNYKVPIFTTMKH